MKKKQDQVADLPPARVDTWNPAKAPDTALSDDEVRELLEESGELFLSHHPKNGWPMVTVHLYCLIDGEIWTTSVKGRVKVDAFKRDDRTCLCVSNGDLTMTKARAVSIKARAEVIEDREIVAKVCRAKAERYYKTAEDQQKGFETLYTPNRVAIRFVPEKIISWDVGRMSKHD